MKQKLIRIVDKTVVAALVWLAGRPRPLIGGRQAGQHWVVIKLVGMGDAVLMLPTLQAIRAAGKHVTVITSARCGQIFAAPGVADQVVIYRKRHWWQHGREVWRTMRACDGVLDFEQHVFWSTAVTMLSHKSCERFGFWTASGPRNRSYHRLVDPGEAPRPMKEIFDDLARAAGFAPVAGLVPLPIAPVNRRMVAEWLRLKSMEKGGYVVIAPGSGATVGFRRLPAGAWAKVITAVPEGAGIVIVGTRVDAGLMAEIAAGTMRPAVQEVEFNLEQLAQLMQWARVVVATDSGPMHLGAAMGARVVGIFGPDTPRRYAPYSLESESVTLDLPCSPCNNCWRYQEARCSNP
ncbi:MAG TPA: glycosyltransferase family 9 protein, partial [Terriglobales bacterium]